MLVRAARLAVLLGVVVTAVVGAAAAHAPGRARSAASWRALPAPPRELVVALGDSVVSGGPCGCWTFPGRYGRLVRTRTGHPVTVRNLGVGGSTSTDLLTSLQAGTRTARILGGASAVTVTIGANDMVAPRTAWLRGSCRGCFEQAADSLRARVVRILRLVRADAGRAGSPPPELLVTTYWNVFREPPTAEAADGRHSAYDVMARRATLLANAALCEAAGTAGATCVDLFRPFKGNGTRDARALLEPDRDHPNPAGHQVIAETLAAHSDLARARRATSAA